MKNVHILTIYPLFLDSKKCANHLKGQGKGHLKLAYSPFKSSRTFLDKHFSLTFKPLKMIKPSIIQHMRCSRTVHKLENIRQTRALFKEIKKYASNTDIIDICLLFFLYIFHLIFKVKWVNPSLNFLEKKSLHEECFFLIKCKNSFLWLTETCAKQF